MAAKSTAYLATYTLSEFDIRNIDRLEARTACPASAAIALAVYFCQKSLNYAAQGYVTTALYETFEYRATTAPLNPAAVARSYNGRNPDAEKVDLSMYRTSDFLQALHDIKKAINTDKDDVALAFALEYAVQMTDKLDGANNGRKARIFFSSTGSPRDRGWTLVKHPFDISLGNAFRKAGRKIKSGTKAIFKKQKPTIHVEARKALPAPAPAAAEQSRQQKAEPANTPADTNNASDKIHQGLGNDVQAMKRLTVTPRKNDGGFKL
jgi:hypothetical protein